MAKAIKVIKDVKETIIREIRLTNDSHNKSINLRPRDNKLTLRQIKRSKKKLCGTKDCKYCNPIGLEETQDGFRIELVKKGGKIAYGIVHPAPPIEKKISSCFRNPYSGKMHYFDK